MQYCKKTKNYSHKHLGLCRNHFAIASRITIFGIKAGFAFCIRSLGNLKLKRATVIYNVFIVCSGLSHRLSVPFHRDSPWGNMRPDQCTFRPDNKEDRHSCRTLYDKERISSTFSICVWIILLLNMRFTYIILVCLKSTMLNRAKAKYKNETAFIVFVFSCYNGYTPIIIAQPLRAAALWLSCLRWHLYCHCCAEQSRAVCELNYMYYANSSRGWLTYEKQVRTPFANDLIYLSFSCCIVFGN